MENKFVLWENTIKKLGENNSVITHEILEKLDTCFNKPPDNSAYLNIYFNYVYNILKAKMDKELKDTQSQEIPFETFVDRYEYMFYTVGTNIRPIILSLCITQPSKVIFVHTNETKENVREIQRYYTDLKEKITLKEYDNNSWFQLEVHPCDDFEVKAKLELKIDELIKNNVLIEKIAFDLTGGKKSIVNTLFTVASLRNIDTFYVDFERYENDNPVPGTEFLRLQKNPIKEFIKQLKLSFSQLPIYEENLDENMKELADHLVKLNLWEKSNDSRKYQISGTHKNHI